VTARTPDVPPRAVSIPVGDYVALVDEADAERVAAHHWRPMVSQSGEAFGPFACPNFPAEVVA
jgi:hypothetical protein